MTGTDNPYESPSSPDEQQECEDESVPSTIDDWKAARRWVLLSAIVTTLFAAGFAISTIYGMWMASQTFGVFGDVSYSQRAFRQTLYVQSGRTLISCTLFSYLAWTYWRHASNLRNVRNNEIGWQSLADSHLRVWKATAIVGLLWTVLMLATAVAEVILSLRAQFGSPI